MTLINFQQNLTCYIDDYMISVLMYCTGNIRETVEYVLVDEYRIEINTTTQSINTNTTSVVLEGKYNIPLEINISVINCVGSSAVVTEEVNVGMLSIMYDVHTLLSVPLS